MTDSSVLQARRRSAQSPTVETGTPEYQRPPPAPLAVGGILAGELGEWLVSSSHKTLLGKA